MKGDVQIIDLLHQDVGYGVKCQSVIKKQHNDTGLLELQMVQGCVESSGNGVFCRLVCPGTLIWIKVLGMQDLRC